MEVNFFVYFFIIAGAGDYTSISRSLTFTPGTGSQQQCTDITILDDSVVENTENFLITLSTLEDDTQHVDFNSLNSATVLITNNDSKNNNIITQITRLKLGNFLLLPCCFTVFHFRCTD